MVSYSEPLFLMEEKIHLEEMGCLLLKWVLPDEHSTAETGKEGLWWSTRG